MQKHEFEPAVFYSLQFQIINVVRVTFEWCIPQPEQLFLIVSHSVNTKIVWHRNFSNVIQSGVIINQPPSEKALFHTASQSHYGGKLVE